MLSSHLHLDLTSSLFPSVFSTKTLYAPLLFPIHATCPPHLILHYLITLLIYGKDFWSLSSSLCNFRHNPVTSVLLTPKYSPQHPILKHPQPTVLPERERPSFTSIHNNRQIYSSVYLNLYIFGQQTGKQKIPHRMIAKIPWLQCAPNFFLNRSLLVRGFPNNLNVPPFQRIYYCRQSSAAYKIIIECMLN